MPTPAELIPLVYDELRRLAAAKLAREAPGHTLDATALVHEAFVKLGGARSFATEGDYLRAAAAAMRRILVDHARRRNAAKRGGGRRVDLDLDRVAAPDPDSNLEALDESLERLGREHPEIAELVTLRHFVGLTIQRSRFGPRDLRLGPPTRGGLTHGPGSRRIWPLRHIPRRTH